MQINYRNEVIIDHRSNKAISEQIYSQLEKLFSGTRFVDQEPIISEKDLSKLLDVKINDVVEAYRLLEKRGYLSYNSKNTPVLSKYSRILDFFSKLIFIEDGIEGLGKIPTTEVISFDIVEVETSSIINLNRFTDKRFLKQARLFKADNQPYFYLEEFYPLERFPKLISANKSYAGNIYMGILYEEYKIKFTNNKRFINVHSFDIELSNILDVQQGMPGFKIELIYYDQYNEPFAYGTAYAPPHFYFEYTVNL